MRRLMWVVVLGALVWTGAYTLLCVSRWEWNRALLTGLLFLAAEIATVTLVILGRLERMSAGEPSTGAGAPAAVRALQETRPHRDHFAWLERSASRMSVFITIMLGAGALFSSLAWIIDRAATRTATPRLERGLALRLAPVLFPTQPLVPDDAELVAEGGPYDGDHLRIYLGPAR